MVFILSVIVRNICIFYSLILHLLSVTLLTGLGLYMISCLLATSASGTRVTQNAQSVY